LRIRGITIGSPGGYHLALVLAYHHIPSSGHVVHINNDASTIQGEAPLNREVSMLCRLLTRIKQKTG